MKASSKGWRNTLEKVKSHEFSLVNIGTDFNANFKGVKKIPGANFNRSQNAVWFGLSRTLQNILLYVVSDVPYPKAAGVTCII